MKRFAAALALCAVLVAPTPSRADDAWELIKDEWEIRPWALFLAAPAFIVTSPFWLGKIIVEKLTEEDEE